AGADAISRSRLRRIKPESPEYAHAQELLGVLAVRAGDLRVAREALARAVGAATRGGAVVARLAEILAAHGFTAEAISRYLEAIVAAEPDLWETHFALGLIARRRGDAAAAERSLRRVLELWPDQPDALHELGVALLMAERTADALGILDTAARLRPQDAGYLADAGFAQLRAGNLRAARQRLVLASELDDTDPITKAYLLEL